MKALRLVGLLVLFFCLPSFQECYAFTPNPFPGFDRTYFLLTNSNVNDGIGYARIKTSLPDKEENGYTVSRFTTEENTTVVVYKKTRSDSYSVAKKAMIELNVDDKESYSGGVITTNAVMTSMGFDENDIILFFDEIKKAEEKYYKKDNQLICARTVYISGPVSLISCTLYNIVDLNTATSHQNVRQVIVLDVGQ